MKKLELVIKFVLYRVIKFSLFYLPEYGVSLRHRPSVSVPNNLDEIISKEQTAAVFISFSNLNPPPKCDPVTARGQATLCEGFCSAQLFVRSHIWQFAQTYLSGLKEFTSIK